MKNEPIIQEKETTLGDAIEGICQDRDRAIAERDKWNRWAVEEALKLHVSLGELRTTSQPDQAGQWEELRKRLSDAIDDAEPFSAEKKIRSGSAQLPGFEVLTGYLQIAPLSWLPALFIRIVNHCVIRKVFKDNEAMIRVAKKAAEQANDPSSILRAEAPPVCPDTPEKPHS